MIESECITRSHRKTHTYLGVNSSKRSSHHIDVTSGESFVSLSLLLLFVCGNQQTNLFVASEIHVKQPKTKRKLIIQSVLMFVLNQKWFTVKRTFLSFLEKDIAVTGYWSVSCVLKMEVLIETNQIFSQKTFIQFAFFPVWIKKRSSFFSIRFILNWAEKVKRDSFWA